jgi:thioredoxin reductase (NADPH)
MTRVTLRPTHSGGGFVREPREEITVSIRNYLGFQHGVSGTTLAARASEQAWRFGAQFVLTNAVQRLAVAGGTCTLTLTDGSVLGAHAIILATGVDYRRLEVPGLDAFIGAGVFYGSPLAEAPRLKGGRAFVVGAGNSAGQAAIHLADHGALVTILARGIDLRETMSEYLVHEIEQAPRITVRTRTTLIAVHGEGRLETITLRGPDAVTDEQADAVFVMIGAHPHTTWLPHTIARDTSGYVLTGTNIPPESWPEERPPFPHETSLPGVLAVGDVRAGSLKRVASAVGEGSLCVQQIHQYLSLTRHPGASP